MGRPGRGTRSLLVNVAPLLGRAGHQRRVEASATFDDLRLSTAWVESDAEVDVDLVLEAVLGGRLTVDGTVSRSPHQEEAMSTTSSTTPPGAARPARRDRTHYLYIAVIVAVLAGIALGFAAPDTAKELKPLGEGFVKLIKMMIGPVIFCTIVLGVGSVRSAAQVGKVGGLALGYFITMSTFALAIGLAVGNFLHPGEGLQLTPEGAAKAAESAGTEKQTTAEFILHMIPDTMVSSLTSGEVLQALIQNTGGQIAYEQGTPVQVHLPAEALRVLPAGDEAREEES